MAKDVQPVSLQLKNIVHASHCTLVVPGVLFAASATMLVYRGITEEQFDLPLNSFLFNILLQMLPLIALKLKIFTCADRVSLVPLVLVKTLIMHVAMLSLRITSQVLQDANLGQRQLAVDVGSLIGALILLNSVFDISINPIRLFEHRDVRSLVILAVLAALASEAFYVYVEPPWMGHITKMYSREGLKLSKVLFCAANYTDIVAFMPVVWRLYQIENELDDCAVGTFVSDQSRKQVQYFFTFMCLFYLWEDILEPYMSSLDEPLAMMAHAGHFVLLLDFAGFFSFQVGTPQSTVAKDRGEQLQGLLTATDDFD